MTKLDELNNLEKQIVKSIQLQNEIASLRLDIINIEKTILQLVENSHHVRSVEKYLSTIHEHMYYNKRERKYMKIFSVRKGKIHEIFEEMAEKYISCPSHSRDSFSMDPVRYLPLLKEEHSAKRKVLNRYSFKEAYSYRGNSNNYSVNPKIKTSKDYEPNFAKFVVIVQWTIDQKGNLHKSVRCKSIRAELFTYKTRQNLINSIFGTKNEWEVSKQSKDLKKCFKKIETSLDLSFDCRAAEAMELVDHLIFLLMGDYLEKISKVRKNSSRFGL